MEKTLNKTNKKKPKFVRQDYTKKKALGAKWRRPKGLHSKIRERRAGHEKRASIGYGSPKKTRHLDSSGLRKVLISNVHELSRIKKGEGIIISSNVGDKKRFEILKKAQSQNIAVLNIKNVEEKITQITKNLSEKKQQKKEKEKTRKQAKEEAEKKAKEKKEEKKEEKEEETKKDLTKKLSEGIEQAKPIIPADDKASKAPKQMKINAPKQK